VTTCSASHITTTSQQQQGQQPGHYQFSFLIMRPFFESLFDFYYINVDVVSFSLSKNQPIFQACPKQNMWMPEVWKLCSIFRAEELYA